MLFLAIRLDLHVLEALLQHDMSLVFVKVCVMPKCPVSYLQQIFAKK